MKDAKEKIENDYKMIIVGNKKDCEDKRQIDFQTLKEFGEVKQINYFEVSAKTGEGIDQIFNDFVIELLKYRNIGIYKVDESTDRTYSSLEKSLLNNKKENCNC